MPIHHAWFSMEVASRHGSAVYLQTGGSPVNVTRTSPEKEGRGSFPHDEKYVGQVVADDPASPARATTRVRGITSYESSDGRNAETRGCANENRAPR